MSDNEIFTAAVIPEEALDPVSVPIGIFEYSEGSIAAPYVQVKTGRDFVVVDDLYVGGDSEITGNLNIEGTSLFGDNVVIKSPNYNSLTFDRTENANVDTIFHQGVSYSALNNDYWWVGSNTTRFLVVTDDGNIGIGTETPTSSLHVVGLPAYANNAAAIAGGLTVGAFYRTGGNPDSVCVVH